MPRTYFETPSRPTTPPLSEKRSSIEKKRSFEIPSIVLTTPCSPCSPTRARSPPQKQIVLLNPATLHPYTHRGSMRVLAAMGSHTSRTLALVVLLAIALWHLYTSLDFQHAVGVRVPPAAMQF